MGAGPGGTLGFGAGLGWAGVVGERIERGRGGNGRWGGCLFLSHGPWLSLCGGGSSPQRLGSLLSLVLRPSLLQVLFPVRWPGLLGPHMLSLLCFLQSSLMDLADVFTAPAPPPASDPWGGPAPMSAPTSDPWGGAPVPPAADPWGGPAPTPASGDPWRPAAPAGPPVDPWGGTQAPAAGEGPTPDPWGSSDGECWLPACSSLHIQCAVRGTPWGQGYI